MDLRLGIATGALLLVMVKPDPKSPACTKSLDLSSPCGCTLPEEVFEPVCGSDGFTYLGPCFLECRKVIDKVDISIRHKGACVKEPECTCPAVYKPKCASNNVTYSNKCVLNCFMRKDRSIRFKHNGECGSRGDHGAYDDYSEEDDGSAKKRPCSAHKKQSTQSRPHQKLNVVLGEKCRCAAVHLPVCDFDHTTYANYCVLYCSAKKNPNIKMRYWGQCSNTRYKNRRIGDMKN